MRLVTIDNGNTHPHVAYFDDGVLKSVVPLDQYAPTKGEFVLISSVGSQLNIKPSFDLHTKRNKTHFFDMKVNYSETLGDDRLYCGYAIFKELKPNEKVLLIDAGTFITCDLITNEGFQGGYIFPGFSRFLGTYGQSAQLPELSKDLLFKNVHTALPHTTEDAIVMATELYLKSSMEEVINRASPDKIIFTGGSATDIKKIINLKVRSETDRHLIHSALSLIYELHLRQE
jgi:type III pantothenate kinase